MIINLIRKNRMTTPQAIVDAPKIFEMESRYQRAQSLMQGTRAHTMVPNVAVFPTWIKGTDCFWYEREIDVSNTVDDTDNDSKEADAPLMQVVKRLGSPANSNKSFANIDQGDSLPSWGKEFRLVNANTAINAPAFDHSVLADLLAEAIEHRFRIDKHYLPITNVVMQQGLDNKGAEQGVTVRFAAFDKHWVFKPSASALTETSAPVESVHRIFSPNGLYAVFCRDYNLWFQDVATGEERALTHDGEEHNCYAVVGNSWGYEQDTELSGLQARWSQDSARVITVRRDSRQVLTIPVVEHVPSDGSIRPKLHNFSVALPGDEHIPEYNLLAIEVSTGHIKAADYDPIPIVRNGYGFFSSSMGWWGSDSRRAYFVDLARDYKTARVVEFDTPTGATRVLLEETSDTHINLMLNHDESPTFVPLPKSDELIWFSERSGWAHLYLYDLNAGVLKHPITNGEWLVRDTLAVDEERRELFIHTAGRAARDTQPDTERDPYYRDLTRVNLDTGELTTLISGDFDVYSVRSFHYDLNTYIASFCGNLEVSSATGVSPSGNFAVVTHSRADSVPVSLLLDRNGQEILELETADMSPIYRLTSKSWQWPEPVKLQAADGTTDIYGLVYRPSDFDPTQSYPVVNHLMNNPEAPWVPKGSFNNSLHYGRPYLDASAVAELGFIVVQIDGRGTCFRNKAFADESYGWMESVSNLEDHTSGIQQLADRYPYMDLDRVGVYSPFCGSGATQAMLRYPDFYKVAVASVLVDDRLLPSPMWSDKWQGLDSPGAKNQYPEAYADNLQGKLLLMHGMLNVAVPPAIPFRIVEALQKANKDFDLLLLPNGKHILGSYAIRRAWDYLVKHLQGSEPPKEFKLITGLD
jgi:dipeptidyl-peptidase-4